MIKKWIFGLVFALSVGGGTMATLLPAPIVAAATNATCTKAQPFLTFPVWYRGLNVSTANCSLASPAAVGGLGVFIWRIALNIIEVGLQLAGYVAAGYILYGGFLFMTSQGSPDGAAKARKTILNAAIGLVVSMASVAIVNLIAGVQ